MQASKGLEKKGAKLLSLEASAQAKATQAEARLEAKAAAKRKRQEEKQAEKAQLKRCFGHAQSTTGLLVYWTGCVL